MDLLKDFACAISGKSIEEIQSTIDTADTNIRDTIAEVKPEWPVYASVVDVCNEALYVMESVDAFSVKLDQEYPQYVRALAEISVQVLTVQPIVEPGGLRQAFQDTQVASLL